jgi:cytochrome c-type biogenesis protein CcmH
MILFWTITIAMIAVAVAFVAPALLRKHHLSESKEYRDGQNVTIAREHLADLDAELANGTLTQALYDQSKLEIEQTLLFDLEEQGAIAQEATSSTPGKMGFIAILIAVPLITVLLYLQLGTIELIEPSTTTQAGNEGLPTIDKMVGDLQKRLEQNPNDADGWYLMGRTMMMMKQYSAAAESYENTYKLVGDEPMVMLALADATAMAQGGNMAGKPKQLVFAAIAIDPNHTTGLWMAGMIAEEEGKDEEALNYWLRLRPLIAEMPSEVAQLDNFIHRAATKLGKDVSTLLATTPSPMAAGTTDSIGGAVVRVTIQLSDALYARVNGEETVFIYAKAMDGPRFPVAAARYQVKDLPVSITLDDSNAVMTTSKLSNFKVVKVGARISYSGDAITQSGDLIGEITNVMVGQSPVTVTINEVSP